MTESNFSDKSAQLAVISSIHSVEGFDPSVFAVEYTDLNKGEKRKKLPVMIQLAWFRLRYPEGRISNQVEEDKDGFTAKARVYPNYKDLPECFLAEATASRKYDPDKPTVSPREWAQTAAIGIALRNAGFGLQFDAAGDDWESNVNGNYTLLPDALEGDTEELAPTQATSLPTAVQEPRQKEKLDKAFATPCPITKYLGRTLGDVLCIDPSALKWVAEKYKGDPAVSEAAQLICQYALQSQTA